jgi:hypothetical protein
LFDKNESAPCGNSLRTSSISAISVFNSGFASSGSGFASSGSGLVGVFVS